MHFSFFKQAMHNLIMAKRKAPRKPQKRVSSRNVDHFAEEVGDFGERIGKRFEERGENWDSWFHRTFGVVGPLISSVFALVIFALIIWVIGIVNFSGSTFLLTIRSFLMVNIGLFFLIFLFFSYSSYFSKINRKAYSPFSPLVMAAGIGILLWIMGNIFGFVGDYTGVFLLSQAGLFLTGNTLFQIFFVLLLIGYAVYFVRVSLGPPVEKEGKVIMKNPIVAHEKREPEVRRLYRSGKDRILGGVCGGIAEYLDVDPVIIRLLWVISIFAWGFGILAYIIAWIIIPRNPEHKWR
jgi:phage shock protein C